MNKAASCLEYEYNEAVFPGPFRNDPSASLSRCPLEQEALQEATRARVSCQWVSAMSKNLSDPVLGYSSIMPQTEGSLSCHTYKSDFFNDGDLFERFREHAQVSLNQCGLGFSEATLYLVNACLNLHGVQSKIVGQ